MEIRKFLVIFSFGLWSLLGRTAKPAADTSQCQEITSRVAKRFDVQKYIQAPSIHFDKRGQLLPPIGSKIFIAWRARTPPHIPDTAFYNYWLRERNILDLSLANQEGQIPKIKNFSSYLLQYLSTSNDSLKLSLRSLTFVNESGEYFIVVLNGDTNHDAAGRKILSLYPDLYFVDAIDLDLDISIGADKKISKLVMKKGAFSSMYLSEKLLSSRAPSELLTTPRLDILKQIFTSKKLRHTIGPETEFVQDDYISPHRTVPVPTHMLK